MRRPRYGLRHMTASEDQAKAERSITEFAATVPLAVNSIESRDPPEPNLLGDVEGEGPIAFEERQVTNESLERCNGAGTIKRAKSFAPHAEHSRLNLGWCPRSCGNSEGAFFRLVKCTTSRPPWQAATGGARHGQGYRQVGRRA
jgi:hypothetical protein